MIAHGLVKQKSWWQLWISILFCRAYGPTLLILNCAVHNKLWFQMHNGPNKKFYKYQKTDVTA